MAQCACAERASPVHVAEFEQRLASDPAMRFSTQDEMLQYARDVLARVEPQLPRLFQTNTSDDGRRASDSRRIARRQRRRTTRPGRPMASRPGWFNMNTYRPGEQAKYTVEALVLHETVPGHHLQVGLCARARGTARVPDDVPGASVFGGLGVSTPNRSAPSSACIVIRRRGSASWRASGFAPSVWWSIPACTPWDGRATVHASTFSSTRRRSRLPRSTATLHGQVRRSPTSWASSKIKRLRRKAEQALGARFDIRDFHDAVLRNGALPLDMLEPQVDAYRVIDQVRAATAELAEVKSPETRCEFVDALIQNSGNGLLYPRLVPTGAGAGVAGCGTGSS